MSGQSPSSLNPTRLRRRRTAATPQSPHPMPAKTEAELRAKFHGLADAVLGADRAKLLADAVIGLDRAADVHGMLRLGAPMMAARLAGE